VIHFNGTWSAMHSKFITEQWRCSAQRTADRLTGELSAARDELRQREHELSVCSRQLKEKEETLEALASACGARPDFLLQLTCHRTLSLSFCTVKLINGHTEHAAATKPGTRLFEDRNLCAPAIAGEIHLDFYSQLDAGTKTGTLRTSPYSICGLFTLIPRQSRDCIISN